MYVHNIALWNLYLLYTYIYIYIETLYLKKNSLKITVCVAISAKIYIIIIWEIFYQTIFEN